MLWMIDDTVIQEKNDGEPIQNSQLGQEYFVEILMSTHWICLF